jgi:hypothetical protein
LEGFNSFVTFKSSAWPRVSEWEGLHGPIVYHTAACMTVTTTLQAVPFKFHICVLNHPKYTFSLSLNFSM